MPNQSLHHQHLKIEMENKPRILVVDDEDRNLRLMEAMLIPLGYEVVLARDGLEALDTVRKIPPDVILLDIMMPRMDGFEVARRLKEDEGTEIIPVVMVTALKDVADRVKALEVGADDFLSKPIDKSELIATVNSQLKVKAYNNHMLNYQKELEDAVAKRTEQLRQAKEALLLESAFAIIKEGRESHFDPEVVDAFFAIEDEILSIKEKYKDWLSSPLIKQG